MRLVLEDVFFNDGPDRLPPLDSGQLTDAQRDAADRFAEIRGRAVFGPFAVLLRSPELMLRSAALGDYVRYRSVLPAPLSELAILITARHWKQSYQWTVHEPIARQAGVSADLVNAISEGRRHDAMSEDEVCIYDFLTELYRTQRVADATYARALARFGEQGIVDLLGIAGHYTFLSLIMNAARTAVPQGA